MAANGIEIANAYVAVTVKAPGIGKDIAKQLGGVDSSGAGRQIGGQVADGMKKSLQVAGAGVAAVLGTALVKGFSRLKAIETAQAKMRGLGHDADTVAKAMDNSLSSVKGTAFGLGEAATAAGQLMAANIKPGKELEGVLKTVGNNASAAGIGFDEMGSIFAKAASQANGIQNDVLGQLADKGIPIYQALGDQMGVTAGEVFKLAQRGKIDFDTFSAAAAAAAGTVADEMGNTTSGSFDNMMAALGRLGAKILEDIFPLIGPLFQDITKWLDEATVHVEPVVDAFGVGLKDALEGVKTGWEWFQKNSFWLGPVAVGAAAAAGAVGLWTGAVKLWTTATKVAEAVQVAFNTATKGNVIMVIVAAIVALVSGLIWFFTQTETGKAIWAEFSRFLGEAWANISGFFTAAYENVIKPVFEGIGNAITWVGGVFTSIWTGFLKPVFDAVAAAASWLFNTILLPAFQVAQFGFAVLGGIFQGIWEFILKPVFEAIGAIFKWLWDTIVSVIIAYIVIQVKAWGAIFNWLWTVVLQPVFAKIGQIFNWVYNSVILPIVNYIKLAIQGWGLIFQWLWVNVLQPVFAKIGEIFNWVWNTIISPIVSWIQQKIAILGFAFKIMYEQYIKPAWDSVASVISNVWNTVKGVIDTMVRVVKTDPKLAFEAARDAIGTAWAGIQELAKKPVKFVVETVINGLIGAVNGFLPSGAQIPKVALPKGFRVGGYTGDVGVNTAAGVVHGREFVTRAESTAKIMRNHPGVLEHMNRHGEIPGYRKGGLVNPLPMGSYSVSQPYHGGHNGIDLAAASGTKVFAAADGVVGLAGSVPMGGNEVYVQHTNGLGTRYSHLSRFATTPGTQVKAGNVIGYVGSTGMSTGPHLHYMVHNPGGGAGNYGAHVNPAPYLGIAGADLGEAGGAASILDGLVDFAVSKVKGAFPEGGMWIDIAAGLAKNAAETMAKAFNPFAASDGHTMLYDNGGWLQPGRTLVENKTGRPERILTDSQWDAIAADRGGLGAGDRLRLVVGGREFDAYIDDRADGAVDRGFEDQAAAGRFAAYV